jgi:hypothetical protein
MMKKLKTLLITLIMITIIFTNIKTVTAESELDQYCDETNSSKWTNTKSKCFAQSFTPSKEYMTKIEVKMKTNDGDYAGWCFFIISVRDSLTGNALRKGGSLVKLLPTYPEWLYFVFDDPDNESEYRRPLQVNTNQQYYIVVNISQDLDPHVYWHGSVNHPYNGGFAYQSNDEGDTWIEDDDFDFNFRTYGYDAPEQPPSKTTNLDARNPSASTIDLTWNKGGGDQTVILRKTSGYPSNVFDGTEIYRGGGTSTTDGGLQSNTEYYYRAWSYDSSTGLYSDGYSSDSETTLNIMYTLNVDIDGEGSVNLQPSGGVYPSGLKVLLVATPSSGWIFTHWSGHLSGNSNIQWLTMDSNKNVVAHFKINTNENSPPNTPSDPFPTDNDYDIGVDATLTWAGGDPDPGDTVTYDIYFGTENPPRILRTNHGYEYCKISSYEDVEYDTDYYWKIVARDNSPSQAETEGPVWHFKTQKDKINSETYWALIVVPFPDDDPFNGVENQVNKVKNTLINGGWNPDHIRIINKCTSYQFKEEFCSDGWLKTHVKPGDKVMIWVYSHGFVFPFLGGFFYLRGATGGYNPWLSPMLFHWRLNAYLDSLRSQEITMIINTCYSGGALDTLKRDERVILTACKENQEGNGYTFAEALRTGFTGWADLKPFGGNGNGLVSSEEAFNFAKPLATDSDTTPLKGDYYPKINFNKKEEDILSVPWDGKLDEYQKQADIFYTMPVETWYAQSFKPGYNTIKEISLQISQFSYNQQLIVSLRKDEVSKPGPVDYDIPSSENHIHLETCSTREWQDINIVLNNGDGIKVTPGDTYYVVIRSYVDQEIYMWGGVTDRGSYSNGEAWRSTDDGATWEKHPEVGDFSFFIFGSSKNHDAKNLNFNNTPILKNSYQYLIKNLLYQFPLLSRLLNSVFI